MRIAKTAYWDRTTGQPAQVHVKWSFAEWEEWTSAHTSAAASSASSRDPYFEAATISLHAVDGKLSWMVESAGGSQQNVGAQNCITACVGT